MSQQSDEISATNMNSNCEDENQHMSSVIQYAPSLVETDGFDTFVDTPITNINSNEDNSYKLNNLDCNSQIKMQETNDVSDSQLNYNKKCEERDSHVFEVPLLDRSIVYPDYLGFTIKEDGTSELIQSNKSVENEQKEEANSDSTVDYSYNINTESLSDGMEAKVYGERTDVSPSAIHSFSPLPSTSRDYDIMNMNDVMFNEISNGSPSENDVKVKIDDNKIDVKPSAHIVECSSSSDNDDVVICNETKPNIIDLSDEDAKFDSDCEIIDVDNIVNENDKVLNVTRVVSPKPHILDNVKNVSSLNDSVEIVPPNLNSLPMPIQQNNAEVQVIPSNEEPQSTNAQECNIPFYTQLKSFFNSLYSNEIEFPNETAANSNTFNTANMTNLHIPFPYPSEPQNNVRRRLRRRGEHGSRKRRRIDSVIDLSVTSTIKPNSSSDVIVIDVDSPVHLNQRSNNVAQISVSIMAPLSSPISNPHPPQPPPPPAHSLHPPAPVSHGLTNLSNPPQEAENQSLSKTPPRNLGDCPVCLENFSKVKAVSTLCGHLFCIGCITTVKTTNKKCPTCRKPLRGKGYHPIFL